MGGVTKVEKRTMRHELEAAFLFFPFTVDKENSLDLEGVVGKTILCV